MSQGPTVQNSPERRSLLAIGFIGPGLVYALTVLGTGDIVSNSVAGASYRYSLLWALGMALIFRYVWVNASAKYVLVTGESLLTGYGRVARWVPWVVVLSFFPMRFLTNQYVGAMMGASAHLLFPLPFGWSQEIWTIFFCTVGFAMIIWGGYITTELFCKVLTGVMGVSLIVAAALSRPDPVAILEGTFIPSLPPAQGLYSSMLIVLALIGTEAGSIANLTYAYFITEKGWAGPSYLRQQRIDLAAGAICLFLMGGLLQVAAAGVIHPLGIQVEDPVDLGEIFRQTQGAIGLLVFSLGLWGSSFSTFVGLNTGHALIVTDVCRNFWPVLRRQRERLGEAYSPRRDPIFRTIVALWSFSPLYIVFFRTNVVWLVLVTASLGALLIPILGLSILKITSDRELMGKYRNGWATNLVLLMLITLALYFGYRNGLDAWRNLFGS